MQTCFGCYGRRNFRKCEETKSLNVINGLVDFLIHDSYKIEGITDRLEKVEKALYDLYLNGVENTLKSDQMLEI